MFDGIFNSISTSLPKGHLVQWIYSMRLSLFLTLDGRAPLLLGTTSMRHPTAARGSTRTSAVEGTPAVPVDGIERRV